MTQDEVTRRARLTEELGLAIDLLRAGLRELQGIDSANDLYHVPLLLLASGLERLMKVLLCLAPMAKEGRMPTDGDVPTTHDLDVLLARVLEECFVDEYIAAAGPREDLDYLRNDARFQQVLEVLSRFGQGYRYFNLDAVLGRATGYDSPEDAWSAIEASVLGPIDNVAALLAPGNDPFPVINRQLVEVLERAIRALARLFTLSGLASEGKVLTGLLGPFLFLLDADFGETAY